MEKNSEYQDFFGTMIQQMSVKEMLVQPNLEPANQFTHICQLSEFTAIEKGMDMIAYNQHRKLRSLFKDYVWYSFCVLKRNSNNEPIICVGINHLTTKNRIVDGVVLRTIDSIAKNHVLSSKEIAIFGQDGSRYFCETTKQAKKTEHENKKTQHNYNSDQNKK